VTPLGAVGRGLLAGIAGTAAMTAWQEALARLREPGDAQHDGGADADPWESASAPARVARRILEGVFGVEVPPERIPLLTHATHWGYGTAWGAAYGLVQESVRARPAVHGPLFGAAVWAMSYVQLVPMGIYEPPWRYSPRELAEDLSYHLVYGAGLAAAHAQLDRGRGRSRRVTSLAPPAAAPRGRRRASSSAA